MIGRMRQLHCRKNKSEREIARMTGLSRNTVAKWLDGEVAGLRKSRRGEMPNKLRAFHDVLKLALKADARSFQALGGAARRGICDTMNTAVDKVKKGQGPGRQRALRDDVQPLFVRSGLLRLNASSWSAHKKTPRFAAEAFFVGERKLIASSPSGNSPDPTRFRPWRLRGLPSLESSPTCRLRGLCNAQRNAGWP